MGSVKSVSSVREKNTQQLSSVLSLTVGTFYFSQIYTEEQNTQRPIKIAAPPPIPPPEGRGVITEIPNRLEAPPPTPPPEGRGVITEIPM